jgi:hypothetical protein
MLFNLFALAISLICCLVIVRWRVSARVSFQYLTKMGENYPVIVLPQSDDHMYGNSFDSPIQGLAKMETNNKMDVPRMGEIMGNSSCYFLERETAESVVFTVL